MQIELQNLQREVGITFILVTTIRKKRSMSDTIGIMKDGKIVQFGSPEELYDAPVNRYVADFVGRSNFFEGEVVESAAEGARSAPRTGLSFRRVSAASAKNWRWRARRDRGAARGDRHLAGHGRGRSRPERHIQDRRRPDPEPHLSRRSHRSSASAPKAWASCWCGYRKPRRPGRISALANRCVSAGDAIRPWHWPRDRRRDFSIHTDSDGDGRYPGSTTTASPTDLEDDMDPRKGFHQAVAAVSDGLDLAGISSASPASAPPWR